MHAPHGRSHDQQHVIDAEPLGHEPVLRGNHVFVAVLRKLSAQPVTWFARLAGSNAIGKDDEMRCGVEQLTWAEKNSAETAAEEAENPS